MTEDKSKVALFELGRIAATFGALWAVLQFMNVATKEDIHEEITPVTTRVTYVNYRVTRAGARVDVISTVYQTREGIIIFWDNLEDPYAQGIELPSGPLPPELDPTNQ